MHKGGTGKLRVEMENIFMVVGNIQHLIVLRQSYHTWQLTCMPAAHCGGLHYPRAILKPLECLP